MMITDVLSIGFELLKQALRFWYQRAWFNRLKRQEEKINCCLNRGYRDLPVKSKSVTRSNIYYPMIEIYRQDGSLWMKMPIYISNRFLLNAIHKTK